MPNKRLAATIAILLLALVLMGCTTPPQPTTTAPYLVSSPVTTSSENWDYISFNDLYGTLNDRDNAKVVGSVIKQWEDAHPDREIVDIDVIYSQNAYTTSAQIHGISIYSRKIK